VEQAPSSPKCCKKNEKLQSDFSRLISSSSRASPWALFILLVGTSLSLQSRRDFRDFLPKDSWIRILVLWWLSLGSLEFEFEEMIWSIFFNA
jgi:hypothetical protein